LRSKIRDYRPDVLVLSDHGCPGLLIGKPMNCKTILVSHHNPARFLNNPLWRLHSELDSRLTIKCENRVLRNVDAVVCPSEYMREMFKKTYDYSGPVTVIPNLVDVELIAATPARDIRSTLGLPDDSVLVYIPSAGSTYKGSRFVFEIIRRLSSYSSKDIGFYLSGTLNAELSHELRFAPSNAKIHAPGQISYADNLAIVKSCSFGISPTLIENFGMALLEACCCGVPMVTFDVGGNADVVSHGRSGFLVPYLDLESLISAACRLLDGGYRESIRRETAKHARVAFNAGLAADQFIRLMN
jgi:glycosyltransferase involved in cell wall biosynthesis